MSCRNRQSDEIEHGSGSKLDESKRVTLFRSKKDKNRSQRRKNKDPNNNNNNNNNNNSTSICYPVGCFGNRVSGGGTTGGGGCLVCFKKGPTRGSPAESPTSDPNSAEFTHEMLRALIEKNEFYSKDCNCHGIEDR